MTTIERVAVVTGGMTGIGLATAEALRARGIRVAVGSRRADDPELARRFHESLPDAFLSELNVCSDGSVVAFMVSVEESLGPVDILVNAAGTSVHQSICDHDEADWNAVVETNLTGPFRMIRACMPGMIARRWGRIVNVASTAARVGAPDYAAYCASKAGLVGLTRVAALEGAAHGVTCTAVSPTWVETDMLRAAAEERSEVSGRPVEDEVAALTATVPQKRLVRPEEVAALIAYLCSEDAAAVTMEDIQINAGALW